jgi:hypothetical protein
MQVRDLVAFLQGLDQDAEVSLEAFGYDEHLESDCFQIDDGVLHVDLADFVDSVDDFREVCAAL